MRRKAKLVTLRRMKISRILFLLLLLSANLPAYPYQVVQDSTNISWRNSSIATEEKLSKDGDLNYPIEVGEKSGWFQSVIAVIAAIIAAVLDYLYGPGGSSSRLLDIFYFISSIGILYLLFRLLKTKYNWIFGGKGSSGQIPYTVETEDIHSIDYELEIENAVSKGDFRLAVRLVYLKTLKMLSDQQLIHWAEGKTNREYQRELQKTNYKDEFLQLSYHFNYLWYGHFEASRERWEAAESEFSKIRNLITE